MEKEAQKKTSKRIGTGYSKNMKNAARELYLKGFAVPEIEKILDVAAVTIRKWAKQEDWQTLADVSESVPKKIYEIYSNVLERTHRLSKDADFDIDNMGKLIGQIEKVQPSKSNGDFTKITTEIATFVQKNMPEYSETLSEILNEFAHYKFRHLYE